MIGFLVGVFLTFFITSSYYENKINLLSKRIGKGVVTDFDHNEILKDFLMEASKENKNPQPKITLGNIYFDLGKFKEAKYWYEEALKIDPKNTNVIVDLGLCYRAEEDFLKALEFFDRALSIDPLKKEALINKALVLLYDLKDQNEAKKVLEILKEKYPGLEIVKDLEKEILQTEKK